MIELITDEQVIDNGLNWVRTKDKFKVRGNHYYKHDDIFNVLINKKEYRVHTVYYGGDNNGYTESTFTRVSEQDKKDLEEKKKAIKEFENKYNVRTDYVDKPFITTEHK